jgi:hypothetical protein
LLIVKVSPVYYKTTLVVQGVKSRSDPQTALERAARINFAAEENAVFAVDSDGFRGPPPVHKRWRLDDQAALLGDVDRGGSTSEHSQVGERRISGHIAW